MKLAIITCCSLPQGMELRGAIACPEARAAREPVLFQRFGLWSDCRDLTGDWQEIAKRPTPDLL
jgi:hypothetical protein